MIRECFAQEEHHLEDLLEDRLDQIHQVLSRTLALDSFEEKRDYIEGLSPELRSALIYGYFELVEGSLLEEGATIH